MKKININNCSDRVRLVLCQAERYPEKPILVEHLTKNERLQIAVIKQWDITRPLVSQWIEGEPDQRMDGQIDTQARQCDLDFGKTRD